MDVVSRIAGNISPLDLMQTEHLSLMTEGLNKIVLSLLYAAAISNMIRPDEGKFNYCNHNLVAESSSPSPCSVGDSYFLDKHRNIEPLNIEISEKN